MSAPTETIRFKNLTADDTATDFTNKTSVSIINSDSVAISVSNSSDSYTGTLSLGQGEAVNFEASSGFTLPTIRVSTSSGGTTNVSVISQ
jgi:hypothetical protein